MKRVSPSPSTSSQFWWPMDREPRARDPKPDRSWEARRAGDESGTERQDRSIVHRHDRRYSRDRLRNLRGSLALDEDDTQWWTV